MNEAVEIRAFVAAGQETARAFIPLFTESGIVSQESTDPEHVAEELGRTKFEALVLDFDLGVRASALLDCARANPANRNAVIFAIVNDKSDTQEAIAHGANFVFERPLVIEDIRNIVHTARDLMVRERRRYFRCAAELPILLSEKRSGLSFQCTTMNVSRSGMAVKTPSPLAVAGEVDLTFSVGHNAYTVRASGTVVWDDKHGKSGISFRCRTAEMQTHLNAWLDAQFLKLFSSNTRSQ